MISQIKCAISGILCIHLLVLNVSVSHSLLNSTVLEKNQENVSHCENWQFQCKRGQCIDESFICDGLKDCKDGSDETYDQCQNKSSKCNEEDFKCDYGACIEKKYQCDGLKQCIDESDESPEMCNELKGNPNRIRKRRGIGKLCDAPASTVDRTVEFSCEINSSKSCQLSDEYVTEFAVTTINCTAGYYQENLKNRSAHICFNGQWSPPISECLKKCDQLNPVNIVLECYLFGISIENCDGNSTLLAGTKVRPRCKPMYKYDSSPHFSEISCNKKGKWDNILYSCIPDFV